MARKNDDDGAGVPSRRFFRRRPGLLALFTLIAPLLLPAFPALAQTASPSRPYVITTDSDPGTYGSRLSTLIYTEAFRRLGLPVHIEHYTLSRRAALVEEGIADGETSRVYAYGADRPNLIRVEESIIDLDFALYTTHPTLRLERIEDLRNSEHLVEYRRGILLCEKTLRSLVAPRRLSDVATYQQGLRKLIAGRTDLYCDLEIYVRQELQSPEYKGAPVRKVITLGDAVPTYPYLNKKHADLAPRLAVVLRQMKTEGLLDAYKQQVERELGW